MAGSVLVRADDHLVLGVQWTGFTLSEAGTATHLTAGQQAHLLIVLPPQHIGVETSPPRLVRVLQPGPVRAVRVQRRWRVDRDDKRRRDGAGDDERIPAKRVVSRTRLTTSIAG
jgi:hypothetical protein